MNVFIVHEKDGDGGQRIDKVFAEESDAIRYVIETVFGSNQFYKNLTQAVNEELALVGYIDKHAVQAPTTPPLRKCPKCGAFCDDKGIDLHTCSLCGHKWDGEEA